MPVFIHCISVTSKLQGNLNTAFVQRRMVLCH